MCQRYKDILFLNIKSSPKSEFELQFSELKYHLLQAFLYNKILDSWKINKITNKCIILLYSNVSMMFDILFKTLQFFIFKSKVYWLELKQYDGAKIVISGVEMTRYTHAKKKKKKKSRPVTYTYHTVDSKWITDLTMKH